MPTATRIPEPRRLQWPLGYENENEWARPNHRNWLKASRIKCRVNKYKYRCNPEIGYSNTIGNFWRLICENKSPPHLLKNTPRLVLSFLPTPTLSGIIYCPPKPTYFIKLFPEFSSQLRRYLLEAIVNSIAITLLYWSHFFFVGVAGGFLCFLEFIQKGTLLHFPTTRRDISSQLIALSCICTGFYLINPVFTEKTPTANHFTLNIFSLWRGSDVTRRGNGGFPLYGGWYSLWLTCDFSLEKSRLIVEI